MAVTLTATARLNNAPYMKSLAQMSAGTAGLANAAVAGSAKAVSAQDKELAARKRLGTEHVAMTRRMQKAYEAADRAQAGLNQGMSESAAGLSRQRYLYSDMSRFAMTAAVGLAAVPVAALAAGVSWERDFANVVRTADPEFATSAARVETLRSSMVRLVQTMPATWGDVTEIATLANQMGIASTQTASFTEAVAMFSATSGVSVDMSASAFGRLNSIVKLSDDGFSGLADSILKVGVNSVATEAEIINVVTQISSIAGAAGMTDKEMIGLSGALASVRVPPELSRGVITRVFGNISRAVNSGGASLEGFSRIAGMTSDEFAQSWGTEGKTGQAFVSFMDGLRKLGPKAEAELRGLGITSVRDVPVMLRLANAADSDGNFGGLLKQAVRDSENAAGETQRQYTIMAQTVGAKFKIVGNNIMAFFDGISRSSLGPLGDVLDFVADGIANVTNSLDKPVRLFDAFDLPFTNSELIGTVGTIGLMTGGLLALGSAVLKVKSGIAGMRDMRNIMAPGGALGAGPGRISAQWTALPGQVRNVMGRVESEMRHGAARIAASRRQFTGNIMPMNLSAGFSDSSARTTAAVTSGFQKMGSVVSSVSRGMGAAASFAFGPWGIAIGLATMAIGSWVSSTKAASTASSDLAQDIATFSDALKGVEAIKGIEVGGLFGQISKPLEEGLVGIEAIKRESADMYKQLAADGAKYGGGDQAWMGAAIGAGVKESKDLAAYGESMKIVNDSFKELVQGGNGAKAASVFLQAAGGAKNLKEHLDMPELADVKRHFQAAFDVAEVDMTKNSLTELYKGTLPGVNEALLGVGAAAGLSWDAIESFEGGTEAFSQTAKLAEAAAAAFINYGDAVKSAMDDQDNFSLDKFSSTLQQQIDAQDQWAENLKVAARMGGDEFVKALVDMGTDSELPLQAMVDNFRETGGSLDGMWKTVMDQIVYETNKGGEQTSIAFATSLASIEQILGDANLSSALVDSVTSDADLSTLSALMGEVGQGMSRSVAEGIRANEITVADAIGLLTAEKEMRINTDLDLSMAKFSLETFTALGNGTITTAQLDALPTLAEGKVWNFVTLANGTHAFVPVDATTGEAEGKVAYFIDKTSGRKGTIPLTANDVEAINKVEGVRRSAASRAATVVVNADTGAARAAISALQGTTYSSHIVTMTTVGQIANSTIVQKQANGGVVDYFANGGVRHGENHVAQIAPANSYRVWGEAETEGEAYIPFARSKRTRSINILDTVAQRFGMSLVQGTDVAKFADGGTYNLQTRGDYGRMKSVRMGSESSRVNIGQVSFSTGSEKDQFREFARVVRRASRDVT